MSGWNLRIGTAASALALAATPLLATGTAEAAAAVYYVDSVNGSDSAAGTSEATAWKTLTKASAAPLVAGSKLLLRRGSAWQGQQLVISKSGTAAAPIVVDSYGTSTARPIVAGHTEACVSLTGSHIELYNLQVGRAQDVGRCEWAGIKVTGNDNVIERNYITGAAAGVYIAPKATYTAVTANDFVDNNHMSKLTEDDPNDDSGAFAILVQGDDSNISWNEIRGSIAFSYDYGMDGAAVEIFLGSRNHVHHNIAVDNDTFTELGTSKETNEDGTPVDPDGTSGNLFEYNVITGPETRTAMVTRGPQEPGEDPDPNGPVLATTFRNNSVRLTNAESQGVVCDAGCTNAHLSMSQNIVQAVVKTAYGPNVTDSHHNVFFTDGQHQMGGSNNVEADPLFNLTNTANPLSLRAGSPAIDLGITKFSDDDVTGRAIDGSDGAVDAGAYEYDK
ncbi:right-handed parallel beta-helix repeat-containing protein [Nonomuraea zeae]|uniref:Right-handed parallel beta-helix repeat-containing protein n=1 Tax=Nonomuraea zeae TaxID=1642303 RepID=A0A5S4G252_9ACTN|nr:right-handed parallel beta-helix repeat-containing protein [Nonomuraea zeae]TMR26922.1 right-handed parallel beta-helix repeat-containing protein [Nonomuraea zeae]